MVVELPNVPPPRAGMIQFESRRVKAPWWMPERLSARLGWTEWRALGSPFRMWIREVGKRRAKDRIVMAFRSKKEMRAMQWRLIEGNPWWE